MSMQVIFRDDFQLTKETWKKVREASRNEWKSFTVLQSGSIINSANELKVLFGPVVGEVTETSANILIEIECEDPEFIYVECKLYNKDGDQDPVKIIRQEITNRRPQSFMFNKLSPDTKYVAWFSTSPAPAFASFKTKNPELDTFKLLALSCDKPSRLLLGQLNPWNFIENVVQKGQTHAVVHLGDQIYPDGEDIQEAAHIFMENYDNTTDDRKIDMMNRTRELFREKYRTYYQRYVDLK